MLRLQGKNSLSEVGASVDQYDESVIVVSRNSRNKKSKIKFFKKIRRLAKRRWQYIGVVGIVGMLLATVLLCLTALLERNQNDHGDFIHSTDSENTVAPVTEIPDFFKNREIPKSFSDYAIKHNSITAKPESGRYILYEIPSESTIPNSLIGLVSAFLLALLSDRALLVEWTDNYEAPGPSDLGGGAGDWQYSFNSSLPKNSERHSSLNELFLNPGFWWEWKRFLYRWTHKFGFDEGSISIIYVNAVFELENMVCNDLRHWRTDNQFIKVLDVDYFASALVMNVYHKHHLISEIHPTLLFSYLSNWLLRPVPVVMMSIQRFSERYFSNNYVVGMEMSLSQSSEEWGTMSEMQQNIFLQEATEAAKVRNQKARNNSWEQSNHGVMILIVTDDEQVLRTRLQIQSQGTISSVGIVAITGPRGIGTKRILSELQELWLLGMSDVCIISSGSSMGAFGSSRTGIFPIIVTETLETHQSTLSYPCYSSMDLLSHLSCFNSDMALEIELNVSPLCKAFHYRNLHSNNVKKWIDQKTS